MHDYVHHIAPYAEENTFLVSGRGLAYQQEMSLFQAKTPPIHF